jgi:outer membrane protein OmpA-like peptidoglycan-associated protein
MILNRLILTIFLLGGLMALPAQEPLEIGQIEELILSIRQNSGDVLFPKKFKEYFDQFRKIKDLSLERPISEVEKSDLKSLYALFEDLNQQNDRIKPYVVSILEARNNALANEANDFSPELFQEAEKSLQELTEKFEKKIPGNSQELINRCTQSYKEAEFEAVRNKLLSEVRILLQESQELDAEKVAPQSLNKVNSLLAEVEEILNARRYNDPTLSEKAAQLLEESKHLLFIVQKNQQLHQENAAFENYLLQLEQTTGRIAQLLQIDTPFSSGLQQVLKNIELSLQDLQNELQRQKEQNQFLQDSIARITEEMESMRIKLVKDQAISEKVEVLKSQLSQFNVKVVYQEPQVILRLNSLQFPLGKLQLNGEDQIRLEKIGEALRTFPLESLLVRLIQNSGGNEQYNQNLAEQRAASVALIIQNSGYLPDFRIHSEGLVRDTQMNGGNALIEILVELPVSSR